MKYPTTRFVFDRKKTATKQKDALIQIEVLHERKKKYISTGVKVYKDQWNEKAYVINRNDMLELNERIKGVKKNVDDYITKLITNNQAFEWDAFERFLTQTETTKMTFIDYVYKRISERNDITASTKKAHMKLISSLMDYGKIIGFEQLTRPNIADYYDWLLGHDIVKIGHDGREYTTQLAPITAWSYMKLLRTYIHDAMLHELINFDPSMGIKVKKGDSEQTRWLSLEEVKKLEETEMPTGSLARVRDLFIYSCYTGLAYSDLMDFKPEKLENDGENTFIYGRRKKTGQEYIVLVLPKAQQILEKYNYNLPKYSNQQYNKNLKLVAEVAGIDKPLSSHWSRITFGFMALNLGLRIEVVSKAMGHATISETQRTYSRILKQTVVKEMQVMIDK